MADALAESCLLASAARHELQLEKQKVIQLEKQKVQVAEVSFNAAAAEVADARGQVERAQNVAAEFRDAAWRSEGLRAAAEQTAAATNFTFKGQ